MYRDDRALRVLTSVRIATPCDASWDAMSGDGRVRRCTLCDRDVYDLSRMTRADAIALLARESAPCVRLHRRRDGTVITSDCTRGIGRRRRRALAAVALATTALAMPQVIEALAPPPLDVDRLDAAASLELDELHTETVIMGASFVLEPDPPAPDDLACLDGSCRRR